jgi:hypothetical protein
MMPIKFASWGGEFSMKIIKTTHLILLTVFFALVGNSAIAEQTSASYRIVNQVLTARGG